MLSLIARISFSVPGKRDWRHAGLSSGSYAAFATGVPASATQSSRGPGARRRLFLGRRLSRRLGKSGNADKRIELLAVGYACADNLRNLRTYVLHSLRSCSGWSNVAAAPPSSGPGPEVIDVFVAGEDEGQGHAYRGFDLPAVWKLEVRSCRLTARLGRNVRARVDWPETGLGCYRLRTGRVRHSWSQSHFSLTEHPSRRQLPRTSGGEGLSPTSHPPRLGRAFQRRHSLHRARVVPLAT